MKIIYQLSQQFLGLVFSGHIRKLDSCRGFYIDLGIALSESHSSRSSHTAHVFHHPLHQPAANYPQKYQRQHKADERREQRIHLLGNLLGENHPCLIQTFHFIYVKNTASLINLFPVTTFF